MCGSSPPMMEARRPLVLIARVAFNLHQPDECTPDQLLATCDSCFRWYCLVERGDREMRVLMVELPSKSVIEKAFRETPKDPTMIPAGNASESGEPIARVTRSRGHSHRATLAPHGYRLVFVSYPPSGPWACLSLSFSMCRTGRTGWTGDAFGTALGGAPAAGAGGQTIATRRGGRVRGGSRPSGL